MPQELSSLTRPIAEDVMLVVDDDPSVLALVVRLLERAGYQVIACPTPGIALDRLAQYSVSVVVSDISMPEMSGFALTQRMHERQPGLPVVLMTGGQTDPDLPAIAMDFGAVALLQKPFDVRQLWAAVDCALERSCAPCATRRGLTPRFSHVG